jgi:hypothetical protein
MNTGAYPKLIRRCQAIYLLANKQKEVQSKDHFTPASNQTAERVEEAQAIRIKGHRQNTRMRMNPSRQNTSRVDWITCILSAK